MLYFNESKFFASLQIVAVASLHLRHGNQY